MKSEKKVGVILLSLSANKESLKIDVHYEDSKEVRPNSSLSITVNVRGMTEMVNQDWQRSEVLVDKRKVFLISLMWSVIDFQGCRFHPEEGKSHLSQAIHGAWLPCAAWVRKFLSRGSDTNFNWTWIIINNQQQNNPQQKMLFRS